MKSMIMGATLALILAAPAAAQQADLGIGGSISGAAAPAGNSLSIGSGINTSISQAGASQTSLAQADAPVAHPQARVGQTVDLSHSRATTDADTTIDKAREQPDGAHHAAGAPVQGPTLDGQ